mgnify:CR=1 FL=1
MADAPFPNSRKGFGPVIVEIPKLLDRQPPVSKDAEMAVLGSMLLDPRVIARIASGTARSRWRIRV